MRRREFIALLGGASATPMLGLLAAHAQSLGGIRKIGILWGLAQSDPQWQSRFGAFQRGLLELGWAEGRNIEFEVRHAVGTSDRFPILAAELVQANAVIIVTNTAGLAAVAQKVTNSIPIVTAAGDLEGTGSGPSWPGLAETFRIQNAQPRTRGQTAGPSKAIGPNLARSGLSNRSHRQGSSQPATSKS